MKYIFFLFLFITPYLSAQNTKADSLSISNNGYIEKYHNQLNIKFEVSNEVGNYKLFFDNNKANISPNIGVRYAFGFNYRFASIRLGIRPKLSDSSIDDKGETDNFKLRVKLLFNEWSHKLEYNYVKGFYIKNTNDYTIDNLENNNHIQFPDMKTSIFSGTSAYKFNNNYSVRAVESQTEIQIKSAGSLMPSVDYWFYKISDTKKYKNPQGEIIEREKYNNFEGINTIVNIGYYYTFVYHKNWYVNVFGAPGVGMDFYKVKTTTPDEQFTNSYNDIVYSLQSGAAVGYSTKKYYFGVDFNSRITKENYGKDQFHFNTSTNTFHLFIGYRFRAPKTVSKTLDIIEEKVPILQKEDSKL